MKKVLVIAAHRDPDKSCVNKKIINVIKKMKGVKVNEIMRKYPDYSIDVAEEQALLIKADIVVFLFPFYWYSSPAILKEWQDVVLEYGFAYGKKGTFLKNKKFFVCITTGRKEIDYTSEGYNRYTMNELILPFCNTAHAASMEWVEPFFIQGTTSITTDVLKHKIEQLKGIIEKLQS